MNANLLTTHAHQNIVSILLKVLLRPKPQFAKFIFFVFAWLLYAYSCLKGDYLRQLKIENGVYICSNKGRPQTLNRAVTLLSSYYYLRLIEIDLVLFIKTQIVKLNNVMCFPARPYFFVSESFRGVFYCLLRT